MEHKNLIIIIIIYIYIHTYVYNTLISTKYTMKIQESNMHIWFQQLWMFVYIYITYMIYIYIYTSYIYIYIHRHIIYVRYGSKSSGSCKTLIFSNFSLLLVRVYTSPSFLSDHTPGILFWNCSNAVDLVKLTSMAEVFVAIQPEL